MPKLLGSVCRTKENLDQDIQARLTKKKVSLLKVNVNKVV